MEERIGGGGAVVNTTYADCSLVHGKGSFILAIYLHHIHMSFPYMCAFCC